MAKYIKCDYCGKVEPEHRNCVLNEEGFSNEERFVNQFWCLVTELNAVNIKNKIGNKDICSVCKLKASKFIQEQLRFEKKLESLSFEEIMKW